MSVIGDLTFMITGDISGLTSAIQNARYAIQGFSNELEDVGRQAISWAASVEQSQVAFETLTGSADKAKDTLDELFDFAAHTPFNLVNVQGAAKQLMAAGTEADDLIPKLTAVGDAVSAVGGGNEQIQRAVHALSMMAAEGAISKRAMNELTIQGIPAWEMLADEIGISVPEALDMVHKRAISASVGIEALMNGFETRFGGAMERQSHTLNGLWSTFEDVTRITLAKVGQDIVETFDLKTKLRGAIDFIQELSNWFINLDAGTKQLAITFAALIVAASPVLFVAGQMVISITALSAVVGAVLSPVGLLAAGFVAVGAGVVAAIASNEEARSKLGAIWDDLKAIYDDTVAMFGPGFSALGAVIRGIAGDAAWPTLNGLVNDTLGVFKAFLDTVRAGEENNIPAFFKALVNGAVHLHELEATFKSVFSAIYAIISSFVSQAIEKLKSIPSDIISSLWNAVHGAANVPIGTPGWAGVGAEAKASGGLVSGSGSGTSDSILAMLSNGEWVTDAETTKKWAPLLAALPHMAGGGYAGGEVSMSDLVDFFSMVGMGEGGVSDKLAGAVAGSKDIEGALTAFKRLDPKLFEEFTRYAGMEVPSALEKMSQKAGDVADKEQSIVEALAETYSAEKQAAADIASKGVGAYIGAGKAEAEQQMSANLSTQAGRDFALQQMVGVTTLSTDVLARLFPNLPSNIAKSLFDEMNKGVMGAGGTFDAMNTAGYTSIVEAQRSILAQLDKMNAMAGGMSEFDYYAKQANKGLADLDTQLHKPTLADFMLSLQGGSAGSSAALSALAATTEAARTVTAQGFGALAAGAQTLGAGLAVVGGYGAAGGPLGAFGPGGLGSALGHAMGGASGSVIDQLANQSGGLHSALAGASGAMNSATWQYGSPMATGAAATMAQPYLNPYAVGAAAMGNNMATGGNWNLNLRATLNVSGQDMDTWIQHRNDGWAMTNAVGQR